jgi:hypothetical protein
VITPNRGKDGSGISRREQWSVTIPGWKLEEESGKRRSIGWMPSHRGTKSKSQREGAEGLLEREENVV